jgi:hypothetical protein
MSKKIQVAILGTGRIADVHMQGYTSGSISPEWPGFRFLLLRGLRK